jgi:hypothetical protein
MNQTLPALYVWENGSVLIKRWFLIQRLRVWKNKCSLHQQSLEPKPECPCLFAFFVYLSVARCQQVLCACTSLCSLSMSYRLWTKVWGFDKMCARQIVRKKIVVVPSESAWSSLRLNKLLAEEFEWESWGLCSTKQGRERRLQQMHVANSTSTNLSRKRVLSFMLLFLAAFASWTPRALCCFRMIPSSLDACGLGTCTYFTVKDTGSCLMW